MTYEEIMKLSDISMKEKELKKFYIEEVGINDWLVEDNQDQNIKFKDRTEYRSKGILHRLSGPAIIKENGDMEYYINGENMKKDEWEKIAVPRLRELKLMRALKKKENV